MRYFPAFLDVDGRPCLVVGGGTAAERKARLLCAAGARVTVVADAPGAQILDLAESGAVALLRRPFADGDAAGCSLVIVATGDAAADARAAGAARAAGVPVNVVDRPALSTFVVPAIVNRDPIVIGISTGGAAPVLARRLREGIEALLPARLGALARFAASFRQAVKATVPDADARRRLWEGFFDGPVAARVLAGDARGARAGMLALVNRPRTDADAQGSVAFVGAGPGDPDLLTLRALSLLQGAEVVVHDSPVSPAILDRARRDADRIAVGQADADRLLLDLARAGKRVVRLEIGEAAGMGAESAALRARGIAVEIVPGVAAPAFAHAVGL